MEQDDYCQRRNAQTGKYWRADKNVLMTRENITNDIDNMWFTIGIIITMCQ